MFIKSYTLQLREKFNWIIGSIDSETDYVFIFL